MVPSEASEFADDLARLMAELNRTGLTGECSPPLDLFESDESLEVLMDLPGVDPAAVRVVAKGNAILIAGEKSPRRGRGDSSFHLVERGYGRFARAVRLSSACDTGQARATLRDGELRISIPKLPERRNRTITIAVSSERPQA